MRFGEFSERMIEGNFSGAVGPESIGPSGDHFEPVVHALDDARGNLAERPEPVEEQAPVSLQRVGDLHHRLDARPGRSLAPGVEEGDGPTGRAVSPEVLEVLLEQVGPHRLEVVPDEVGKLDALVV